MSSSTLNLRSKPLLSLRQIINMSVGFFGIQFAFGLQNTNVSRIFQTLGADIDDIPILWIAAPVTGLLVQPIIGHISDKTWLGRLGRRRPFFMLGAILAALALFVFPDVNELLFAAIMLWVLDASINISMEPFRAFVGDMLPDSQRTQGFAAQSFFIGTGAVISSLLPTILTGMGVSNQAPEGVIPDSVRISFYIGAVVFIAAVLYTVLTTREYSPDEMKAFGEIKEDEDKLVVMKTPAKRFYRLGVILLLAGFALSALLYWYNENASYPLKKELYVLTIGIAAYGVLQIFAGLAKSYNSKNGFLEIMDDMNFLPEVMKKLAVVQFFSWFALFSMWIYAVPALTQHIAGVTDTTSKDYNDLANWWGVLGSVYNGVAAIFAFSLPLLVRKFGRPVTHLICLTAGGLGLISFFVFNNPDWLVISMIGVGIAWCSILAMPYSMLTQALPARKMGVYMGIFNFFIVLPQILAATILGVFTDILFGGQAIYSIVLGGVAMIVGGVLTLRIREPKQA